MEHFTPASAANGGLLIAMSAVITLLFDGRILVATGIAGGLNQPVRQDAFCRVSLWLSMDVSPTLL